jgi:hypothetical protein
MRRNGDEEKRRCFERRPTRLCLGEPRLCEIGVLFVGAGTDNESCLRLIDAVFGVFAGVLNDCCGMASTRENFEDLCRVPSDALDRLDCRTLGSTFSASNSSAKGESRRLVPGLRDSFPGEQASWVGIAVAA